LPLRIRVSRVIVVGALLITRIGKPRWMMIQVGGASSREAIDLGLATFMQDCVDETGFKIPSILFVVARRNPHPL
jgi:hypothetical protein